MTNKTDLDQFVADAITTESDVSEVKVNKALLENTMALFMVAGDLLDQIKKNAFYGKSLNITKTERNHETAVIALNHLMIQLKAMDEAAYGGIGRETIDVNPRIFHSIIGMATESTELVEALHKNIVQGKEFDGVNFKEELGDLAWYMAIGLDETDNRFDDVLSTVIAKLKARYPNKFTSEDAINRDLETERAILENK